MKVLVRTIADAFKRQPNEQVPIDMMVDSISDFKRKLQIHPSYKELKEAYDLFNKERQAYVKKLIEEYCKESNEDPETVTELPGEYVPRYNKEIEKMLEAEYTLNRALKFSQEELEHSKLPVSYWVILEPFLTIKEKETTKP